MGTHGFRHVDNDPRLSQQDCGKCNQQKLLWRVDKILYYMALKQKHNQKLCYSDPCPVIVKIWYVQ